MTYIEIATRCGGGERRHELVKRIFDKVKDIPFDVESGGLLYDLLTGCGLTDEDMNKGE